MVLRPKITFRVYSFDLLFYNFEYVACLEAGPCCLMHTPNGQGLDIAQGKCTAHRVVKVCEVYNRAVYEVCKIVQTAPLRQLRLQQSPSISVTSCQRRPRWSKMHVEMIGTIEMFLLAGKISDWKTSSVGCAGTNFLGWNLKVWWQIRSKRT